MRTNSFRREKEEVSLQRLRNSALRMLARRDHSVFELKTKLRQKYLLNDSNFQLVVDYLKKYGYLAKEEDLSGRWAKAWRSEGRGRHWISGKLKTKGLPDAHLKDDHEEFETARLYLTRKLRGKEIKSLSFTEKSKITRTLVGRGFSHSIVANVLAERGLD